MPTLYKHTHTREHAVFEQSDRNLKSASSLRLERLSGQTAFYMRGNSAIDGSI